MYATDGVGGSPATLGKPEAAADSGGKGDAAAVQFSDALQVERETQGKQSSGGEGDTSGDQNYQQGVDHGPVVFVATPFSEGGGDQGGTFRAASDGTFGKTEYLTVSGDTLPAIARERGQSVADVLAANPHLSADTPLEAGMTIAFLDGTRLRIAREMAAAASPARLEALVIDEILYAASLSSTPADLLAALQQDLRARRPEDGAFAAIVDRGGAAAAQLWRNQGRSHEVMDRLQDLTDQGDGAALKEVLLGMFGTVAQTTPSAQAIEGQYHMLLVYGPQDPVFLDALAEAEAYFSVGRPQQVAAEIAILYAEEGPGAAARVLAERAGHGHADPLTATRILDAAQPTIAQIITHLGFGGWHPWPGNPTGAANFYIDPGMKERVFGDLGAVADNASRGPEGAEPVAAMAAQVNEQGFLYVSRSIIDGDGVALPLAMLAESRDPVLAATIAVGLDALKERIRGSVREFAETAYPATGPAVAWGGLLADPETAFQQTLDVAGPDGITLRQALGEDIARLDADGRQMMRAMQALGQNAHQLAPFPELLAAGEPPAEGSDPEIELVLGSQGAFAEALRGENLRALQSGMALDPYAVVGPGSFFARMIANSGRSGAQAFHGLTAADFGSGTGLGLGLSFYRAGTYGFGAAANAGDPGWRAQGLTLLNALGAGLEGALALSGVYAGRHGLVGLTPAELNALAPANRQIALAAAGHPGSLLMSALRWHVRAFGVLNLASGADALSNGAFLRGVASLAVGGGTLAAAAPQTTASLVGLESGAAARIVFWGNVVTLVGSGVLMLISIEEQRGRRAALEAIHVTYLEQAGMSPAIARALVDLDGGPMPAAVMQALSDHLRLRPGELLDWFNRQDAGLVEGFRYWGLQLLAPDESGRFPVIDSGTTVLPPHSLEDLVRFARNGGLRLPDRRYQPAGGAR